MKDNNKSLTNSGITGPYCLLIMLSVLGMAVSLYLNNHYMAVKFPQGLMEASACDINSFFNCDSSTNSPFSNVFGLPIAVFGILFFVNLIASAIFPSESWERANHLLAWINVAGCAVLFFYTVIFLKTMCPFCVGHWAISIAVAILFWKKGLGPAMPSVQVLACYLGFSLAVLGGFSWNLMDQKRSVGQMAHALIQQFNAGPLVQPPSSPHKIYMSTENFADAPLRISKFSDFQCPACKSFADIVPQLVKRYEGKVNVQYFFYPLDHNCNKGVKRILHPFACSAAVLAHCAQKDFLAVHDEIFVAQNELTQGWIEKKAQMLGISDCYKGPKALDFVKKHIDVGDSLGVQSTPTLIVNGKKVPGSLPLEQLYLLFDQIFGPAMKLIETHFHLDYIKGHSPQEALEQSQAANVEKLVTIAVEPSNLETVREFASLFPPIYCTQGVHPHDIQKLTPKALEEIEQFGQSFKKCVAIGEIGLDYHYDNSPQKLQQKAFAQQLDIAARLDLPVVIHSRDADEDTQSILGEFLQSLKMRGVIHSFTAGKKLAEFALSNGFFLGLNGIITFKNAENVRSIVEFAPIEQIVLETDAPFLAPAPYRGKENGPWHLPLIANKVAEIKNKNVEELLPIIYQNSHRLFGKRFAGPI